MNDETNDYEISNETSDEVHSTVLAIDPGVRGFGFAYFETPQDMIDWGVRAQRFSSSFITKRKIIHLIADLNPDVVVIEHSAGTHRSQRIRVLLGDIAAYCAKHEQYCVQYTRDSVRAVFADFGITTKAEIAKKLTTFFPELERALPSKRELWMTEDPRFGIFDAAALAFTYYAAH